MRHFLLGLFLVVVLLPLSASAAASVPSKIPMVAVMPFTGRTLDSDALETIAATLATNLLNTGMFRVMERSQMASILKEQGFQQSGACDGSECAVEVGKPCPGSVGDKECPERESCCDKFRRPGHGHCGNVHGCARRAGVQVREDRGSDVDGSELELCWRRRVL